MPKFKVYITQCSTQVVEAKDEKEAEEQALIWYEAFNNGAVEFFKPEITDIEEIKP